MKNILIVYYNASNYPLRTSYKDYWLSFQKHSDCQCFYINLAIRRISWYIQHIKFDLIIFENSFCTARWTREHSQRALERAQKLKTLKATKVAMPQDEFVNTDWLCKFINEFDLDCVFSVAPESEWPIIYATVDFERTRFYRVLTGYLEEETLNKITKIPDEVSGRTIDIGYRTGVFFSGGRFSWLKHKLATIFQTKAQERKLKINISSRFEDFFTGDAWYRFLLSCKYTLGVEGGASVLDRDGTIQDRSVAYMTQHPEATPEQLAEVCFPNLDGSLRLRAISPRHLEACATKTCQVLIEGDYNGILLPDKHYILLKEDFSNIDEVLDLIEQDTLREEITERAYQDIIVSGKYTYQEFVKYILKCASERKVSTVEHSWGLTEQFIYQWARFSDWVSWRIVALIAWLKRLVPYHRRADVRKMLVRSGKLVTEKASPIE